MVESSLAALSLADSNRLLTTPIRSRTPSQEGPLIRSSILVSCLAKTCSSSAKHSNLQASQRLEWLTLRYGSQLHSPYSVATRSLISSSQARHSSPLASKHFCANATIGARSAADAAGIGIFSTH